MLKTATPILASLNAEETISFYTKKLGFTFHNNWDGYVIFSKDEISIHLWPTSDPEIPKNTGCYVYVTAVDELYQAYSEQGVIHPNGKLKTCLGECDNFRFWIIMETSSILAKT